MRIFLFGITRIHRPQQAPPRVLLLIIVYKMHGFCFAATIASIAVHSVKATGSSSVVTVWSVPRTWERTLGETEEGYVVQLANTTANVLNFALISRKSGKQVWKQAVAMPNAATVPPTIGYGDNYPSSIGSGIIVVEQQLPPCHKSYTAFNAATGKVAWRVKPMPFAPHTQYANGTCGAGMSGVSSFIRHSQDGVILTARLCTSSDCRYAGAPPAPQPVLIFEAKRCDAHGACTVAWAWSGDAATTCTEPPEPSVPLCSPALHQIDGSDGRGEIAFIPTPGANHGRWSTAPPLFRVTVYLGFASDPSGQKSDYQIHYGFDANTGSMLCGFDMNRVYHEGIEIGSVKCDRLSPRHPSSKQPYGLLKCMVRVHDDYVVDISDPQCGSAQAPGPGSGARVLDLSQTGSMDGYFRTLAGPSTGEGTLQGTTAFLTQWIGIPILAGAQCVDPKNHSRIAPFPSVEPNLNGICGLAVVDMLDNRSDAVWYPEETLQTTTGSETNRVYCQSYSIPLPRGGVCEDCSRCSDKNGDAAVQPGFAAVEIAPTFGSNDMPRSVALDGNGVVLLTRQSPMGAAHNTKKQNQTLVAVNAKTGALRYTTTLHHSPYGVTTNNVPSQSTPQGLFAAVLRVDNDASPANGGGGGGDDEDIIDVTIVIFAAQDGKIVYKSPVIPDFTQHITVQPITPYYNNFVSQGVGNDDAFAFSRITPTDFSFIQTDSTGIAMMHYLRNE